MLLPVALAAACLPTRPEGELRRVVDEPDAGPVGPITLPDGGGSGGGDPGSTPSDPHGLSGADPPHGRFIGGVRVVIQGSGFAKKPRVWFGDAEVAPADVVAISEKKLQVVTPPGKPGPVDIKVQNGDDASTRRSLIDGFTYDPFYADPDNGPTSGGTQVRLHGADTGWSDGVQVKIGDKPCADPVVLAPTELTCTAAASAAGSRSITVLPADGGKGTTVLDAYAYADSDNGFKGGLSGDPLPDHPAPGQPPAGTLRVLAFDSYTGAPLPGAKVYVGTEVAGVIDASGVAVINGVIQPAEPGPDGAPAPGRLTVTVAKKCAQPTTFVDVPVSTVTMYLDPILSPNCAPPEGDPPPTGGKPGVGSSVTGEVRFPSEVEFKKAPWSTVPAPSVPDERRVAYLFNATGDPKTPFSLPDVSKAITEQASGDSGYNFSFNTPAVGNLTLYALAGIENRAKSPPTFVAYAFGVAKGVSTKPGEMTPEVTLVIDQTLDQSVTLDLAPPAPGAKGPDRLQASVALSLGIAGYAVFPGGQRTVPMPLQGALTIVGLPPLDNSLAGLRYVASAIAATGPQMLLPLSSAANIAFQDTSKPLPIDGFVRLPSLVTPGNGPWDGSSYKLATEGGGAPPDLLVFDLESGGGLVSWTVAAPGTTTGFTLPDLRKQPGAGLVTGPVTVTASAATLEEFSYKELRYRHLARSNWISYAQDAFYTQLPP